MTHGLGVPAGWGALAARYQPLFARELTSSIFPFWARAWDEVLGGVFSCWNNAGTELVSRDKFVWSQGRFAWLLSRWVILERAGLVNPSSGAALAQAERTVAFLRRHAVLAEGRCAFVLSAEGGTKEARPGLGLAPSIYADCFVVMGVAEFAGASGDMVQLEWALDAYRVLEARLRAPDVPTYPSETPPGYRAHGPIMIGLNVACVLEEACRRVNHPAAGEMREACRALAAHLFETFFDADGRIAELRPTGVARPGSLLERHVNPGHSLESLWMLLGVAVREARADWVARAAAGVRRAFELGWDAERGGLFHFVDREGGPPRGEPSSVSAEAAVRRTWDRKLWWVHTEAMYAALLSYRHTGDEVARGWFEQVSAYALATFPNPDPAIGEWIQIRNRDGAPVDDVVALPVKDPYHIARNLMLLLELFDAAGSGHSGRAAERTAAK